MHTFPSMEAVAMWMEFEGVGGSTGEWVVLPFGRGESLTGMASSSSDDLLAAFCRVVARDVRNGEIEMEVMLAECAAYTRRALSFGIDNTCYKILAKSSLRHCLHYPELTIFPLCVPTI